MLFARVGCCLILSAGSIITSNPFVPRFNVLSSRMYSKRIAQAHPLRHKQTSQRHHLPITESTGQPRPCYLNRLLRGIAFNTGSSQQRPGLQGCIDSHLRASVATAAACSCFALAASIAPAATGLWTSTRPFVTLPLPWPIAGTQLVLGATADSQRQPRSLHRTPNCPRQRCCTRARYPSEPIRGGASRTGFSGRSSITTA
ncbi:hypothetical protein V8C26DRAFT_407786 [Trichoderma gracile]